MVGRSRNRRYGAAVAAGAAVMTFVSSCAALVGEAEPTRVLIGVDLALGSPRGEVYHNALELRVEQVNEQGLLGDRQLELLVLDNRSDRDTSVANLAELTADPQVAAIVTGACDECTLGAVDTINDAGVPTIALGSASELVEPTDERPYLFQMAPRAGDNARVLAGELDRADVATIGLVTSDDLYGEEGSQRMTEAAARVDVDVVVEQAVGGDQDSIDAAVAELLAFEDAAPPAPEQDFPPPPDQAEEGSGPGPDAVVLWAREPAVSGIAVALRDQGYEGSLFLDSSAADELFYTGEVGAALDDARMVFTETLVVDSVIATSPAKAARQAWFREYTARYGTYHAYSSFAADTIQILVEAITRFDDAERETLRDAIERVQIEGLSGPIRIRLESHSGLSPQALTTLVVQGDRWRLATS